jgi:hypothetical protein
LLVQGVPVVLVLRHRLDLLVWLEVLEVLLEFYILEVLLGATHSLLRRVITRPELSQEPRVLAVRLVQGVQEVHGLEELLVLRVQQ